jgi:phospholipid/cholesterol/gamma-HCH transport system substrate-binding protein
VTTNAHAKQILGLVYLMTLCGLILFSVLVYQQAMPWQRTVAVTLRTQHVGLQLNPHSDVKIKGVLVGRVDSITSDGTQATLHLALDPSMTRLIPAAVDATIVPKTLFGAKQVNLIPTAGASGRSIQAGDVITQSTTAVEIGELYTNLEGVLQTLQPAQLSMALNSLADALQGRGAQLGDTTQLLNTYLTRLNPHLPTLVHDLDQLASTSDIYAAAAPDLLRTLDNVSTISTDLLIPHEEQLTEVLKRGIDTADEVTGLLDRAGPTLVGLNDSARPVLDTVAEYSPELPCLFDSMVLTNKATDQVQGSRGPYQMTSIDGIVHLPPYAYPEQLPSTRSSPGNNDSLPPGVPNWQPHCAAVPSQLRGVRDVGPFALADGEAPTTPATPTAPSRSPDEGTAGLLLEPLTTGR